MTNLSKKCARAKPGKLKRITIQPFMRGNVVYLKLFLAGKSIAHSTALTCRPVNLDKSAFEIKMDENGTNILQALRTRIQETYSHFILAGQTPDLRQIWDIASKNGHVDSKVPTALKCLESFLKDEFEMLEGIEYEKKTVDKKRYIVQRTKQYFLSTYNNPYLRLSDIKPADGQQLVNFCKKQFRHGHNHAVLHAEFLKRTLNYAITQEWIDKNPLAFFRPRRERKEVVALKEGDIRRLAAFKFNNYQYDYVRDVFLFCCFTGLSYVDINRLSHSHLSKTISGITLVKIQRGKNGNICTVPLVDQAIDLIDKYATNADSLHRGTLFPVFSNQAMNRFLKEIQGHCGLEIRLTTHVARKTCASYYIANGVPLTSVAAMLGHKKTSTTEQYYTQRSEDAVIQHIQEFKLRKKQVS